jgi:predicted Zn-dependent peptidase
VRRATSRRLIVCFGAGAVTAVILAACQSSATGVGETLPGRSRPLLANDWPHPRDYKFAASKFVPPDPRSALIATKSGLRAYVIPTAGESVVRITAAVPLGRFYEQADEAGASAFITHALMQPTAKRSAEEQTARLEALATRLELEESLDVATVTLDVLAEDWHDGVALLIDMLRRFSVDDAAAMAYKTGSGYARETARVELVGFRPTIELERVLGNYSLAAPKPGMGVSAAAVRSLSARSLRPNRIVLGIGGGVQRTAVETVLDDLTRGWEPATEPLRPTNLDVTRSSAAVYAVDDPSVEGWIAMGHVVGAVPDAERAPLAVAADILNTRLNIAAREIRGLANRTILVLPDTATGAGLLQILTGGRFEAVAPLVKFSLDEVTKIHDAAQPLGDGELERGKGAIVLGQWQTALDGVREASATYAVETVRYGGIDRLMKWPASVQQVTAEQVKAAALKYLDPADMVTVVVGPLEQIRRARHPRWPITLDGLNPRLTTH